MYTDQRKSAKTPTANKNHQPTITLNGKGKASFGTKRKPIVLRVFGYSFYFKAGLRGGETE